MSDSHITHAILKLYECFLLEFWVDETDSKIRLGSEEEEETPNEMHSDKYTNHLQMLFQFSLVWAAGRDQVCRLFLTLHYVFTDIVFDS